MLIVARIQIVPLDDAVLLSTEKQIQGVVGVEPEPRTAGLQV